MKFRLFFEAKAKDDFITEVVDNVDFDDVESARSYAKDLAYSIYYMNPVRDILEIMAELKVNEEKAHAIFMQDIEFNTNSYVEEVLEKIDGQGS